MKIFGITAFAALGLVVATSGQTQESGEVVVALGVSSFGGNLEAGYNLADNIRLRGALMGGLSYSETENINGDTTYDIDGQLGGVATLVDYYPTDSGWRVSGGLFFSNTSFDGFTEATAGDPIVIDGVTYGDGSLTTDARFNNEIAPMLTTGYDLRFGDGWAVNTEVGAVFVDGVDLNVTAGGDIPQSEVDEDADYQNLREDAADLALYPYLGLSVSFSF